jgi:hypothetical protein
MNMRYGLAACGVIAALAASVAGCSSGASSTPSTSGGASSAAAGVASSAASAAAGGGGASPSWAAALGSAVTVMPPTSASPGLGSPQAAVTGDVENIESGQFLADCAYVEPDEQAECKSSLSSLGPSAMASAAGTAKNFAIGYTVVDGNEALVGTTGTFCSPDSSPSCFTNTDPAAIFSTGKSFATLWSEANGDQTSSSAYSLAPCIEVGGKWYLNE